MDCSKIGSLILRLRKEKNLTQKNIAEQMNISDKTISKWERGLGCPDVSLLAELSNVLGVNIEKILLGDLEQKETDGGNMRGVKFYICKSCGNVITSTSDTDLSCCGRKLEGLVAGSGDEDHKFIITEIENDLYIKADHEMTKSHYISFVAYVTYDRLILVKLYPEQNAELRIPRIYKGKLYAYCTEHGLWVDNYK